MVKTPFQPLFSRVSKVGEPVAMQIWISTQNGWISEQPPSADENLLFIEGSIN
jgi:hypothetical protein